MTNKFRVEKNNEANYFYIKYSGLNPIIILNFPTWIEQKDYMFIEFEENVFKLLGKALAASITKTQTRIWYDGGWAGLYYKPEDSMIYNIDDEGNASRGQSYSEFVSECIELLDFINTLKAEKGIK